MADEEALLKKKLESTTDFEERREIRQQLRELRKKKLDALQSDTTANERPRRRDRVKREEQSTVITETKTTAIRDSNSSQPAQTIIEVNYSRTVVTDEPSENGIENGHVESVKSVEEETVSVEDETPVEELPVEVEIGTQFTVQINGAKSLQDSEEEQGTSAPQEISSETETVVETSETATDGKEEETDDKEEEMEEVELTPEVIEKIEDVDQLEKLLKEVPLNEYALRKAIRLQIRQLKVKQEVSKETQNVSRLKKENRVCEQDNFPRNEDIPSTSAPSQLYGTGELNETKTAAVSTFNKLVADDEITVNAVDINRQSLASDSDGDDASSSISSSTSDGTCSPRPDPKSPPPRPPKPSRLPASTVTTDLELKGDFKTKILGASASPLRDLTKKPKPSGPEQLDFRGQLKKTGLRADKDLTTQGKKHQQEGDLRRQLKTTSADTSRNLSAVRNVGKKKGGVEQIDFRGLLNKTKGSESAVDKKGPPRPPPTYLSKKAEPPGGSACHSPARTQTKEASEDVKTADAKEGRKISSADLLNMLHKPVETSKESFLVQRGIKKADAPKSAARKVIVPTTGTCDESFQARMAQRKARSDKLIPSVKDAQTQRRTSSSDETKDFRAVLKKAAVQKSRAFPKQADLETEEELSTGKLKQNERFSVDIQDKNELQKLRAQLIQEKETKEKTTPGGKSMTKTVKSEGDGTKEVTTTTEKTTEVEETDAGPAEVTTEVKKTTEVHKAGGATMTVTKTSRTTEVRQTGGSKGMSIDALFAQKKKDRMMAKKQLQTDVKNKRMAFKQQLEAQSPKVEGGGRNFTSGNTAINQLQEWCRRRTKYHEGVDIQNFTTSWANGLAMCALLNYFLPEKIPYETLDPNDKRGNWGLAFKVAGEEGIEPLLELEDVMSVEVPEPKSLITYVHFIYQHFAEKQQQQKNA